MIYGELEDQKVSEGRAFCKFIKCLLRTCVLGAMPEGGGKMANGNNACFHDTQNLLGDTASKSCDQGSIGCLGGMQIGYLTQSCKVRESFLEETGLL